MDITELLNSIISGENFENILTNFAQYYKILGEDRKFSTEAFSDFPVLKAIENVRDLQTIRYAFDEIKYINADYEQLFCVYYVLFCRFCTKNDLEVVKFIHYQCEDVPVQVGLTLACKYNNIDIVKYLLDDVAKPTSDIFKALINNRCFELIKLFIHYGFDINSYDTLTDVLNTHDLFLIKFFIEELGLSLQAFTKIRQKASIIIKNDYRIVEYLISKGINKRCIKYLPENRNSVLKSSKLK